MNHKTLLGAVLLTMVSGALFAADADFGALGAKNKTGLSLEEMLTYAIQDEHLARAEYETIIERYGDLGPFTNIVRAEERHIRRLRETFAVYGLTVPRDTSNNWVVAQVDLKSALETGVQTEIDNIAMYRAFLGSAAATPVPAEVRQLFERLAVASENHLRAFSRHVSRRR